MCKWNNEVFFFSFYLKKEKEREKAYQGHEVVFSANLKFLFYIFYSFNIHSNQHNSYMFESDNSYLVNKKSSMKSLKFQRFKKVDKAKFVHMEELKIFLE